MLLLHDNRMGFGALPTSAYCRAPFWEAPQSSSWFAPHRFAPLPAMNVDSYKSPVSPQSDSDVSHSSSESREALLYSSAHSPSTPGTYIKSPDSTTSIHSEGPAVCLWEGCGKSFNKLNSLSGHVAVEHATAQGGLFYCGWKGCLRGGRGFNARYKMLVHVRTHTKERPHSCPVCGKSFSRAENLKIHARSHSGEKPYVCTVPGCGKAYSNSSDRFKHTRTHMVEKPYCCKIPGCQKRYTDPSSLRKHVKTFKHINTTPVTDRKNISNDQKQRTVDEIVMLTTLDNHLGSYKQMSTPISLSECEEQKEQHTLRKYSHSENDCYIMENIYQINIDTKKLHINNENEKEYEESVSSVTPNNTVNCETSNDDDEYNKLCFCKDLPCVHTRRYVQPEYSYITIQSIPYHKNTTGTSFLLHSDIKNNYIEEPLDLKRKYFDSSIMEIEKKSKSDYSFIQTACTELPLDLSRKKFF